MNNSRRIRRPNGLHRLESNITMNEVRDILHREKNYVFSEDDVTVTFVCLNTWVYLYQDIVGSNTVEFRSFLCLNGLGNTIAIANDFRNYLTHHMGCSRSEIRSDLATNPSYTRFRVWDRLVSTASMYEMLFFLGFPKRLRLEGKTEVVANQMIADYLASNRRCRLHQTVHPITGEGGVQSPIATLNFVRDAFEYILEGYQQHSELFILPPGATQEGANTYYEKFLIVICQQQWLRDRGVNIPWIDPTFVPLELQDCASLHSWVPTEEPSDCNRYVIVPKNFEIGRGVAPEPVSRQILGYQVDAGIRECLRNNCNIDLTSQERNQLMASTALMSGYATVDFHAASDSISYWLVEYLCRNLTTLWDRLQDCRTNFISVRNQKVPNGRFATMGNAVTFSLETAIFLAVALVAIRFTYGCSVEDAVNFVTVYGDDVILPNAAYDTYVHISTELGFAVNEEKSFHDGSDCKISTYTNSFSCGYRESCGVEAFISALNRDSDISDYECRCFELPKWPRGTSKHPELGYISLQHKLVDYYSANAFLCEVVRTYVPYITQSAVDSPYQDLWQIYPIVTTRPNTHYGQIATVRTFMNVRYRRWEDPNFYTSNPTGIRLRNESNDVERRGNIVQISIGSHSPTPWYWHYDYVHETVCLIQAYNDLDLEEEHTTVTSRPTPISTGRSCTDYHYLETLAYLAQLGRLPEFTRDNSYVKDEKKIACREDLISDRVVTLTNEYYPI